MKKSKYDRILSLYSKLTSGEIINKTEMANEFEVNERTIQRDIDDIRAFYYNNTFGIDSEKSVIFNRKLNGYVLTDDYTKCLTNSEILAVCKILLESRSMREDEMMPILDKLLDCCVPETSKKAVKSLISNERFHYVAPKHGKHILNGLWEIGQAVEKHRVMEIEYTRLDKTTVKRTIEPVGLLFSEFYFYLVGFIKDIDKKEHFDNPNDIYPTIYRIDRINKYTVTNDYFNPPYKNRFEEGEFRKRIQFMYGGKLQKTRFTYCGKSVEAVLDRLPTAKILSEENGNYLIEAETFGNGIDMWLNSQGENIDRS